MQKIFDSHLHLWDLSKFEISWLKGDLNRNFCYEEYKNNLQGYELLGAMYVEVDADDKCKESVFALDLKRKFNLDLCLADLKHKNELCAFREVLHTTKIGAKRLFEEDFRQILKELEYENLVFEACIRADELSFLSKILSENPKLKVVLNHMGSPRFESFDRYKKDLKRLKEFKNLYIKLSAPDNFSSIIDKEFINEIFSFLKLNFGESRLLFGTNYPVAKLGVKEWINLIKQSDVFQDFNAIFYKNALRIYKGV